MTILVVGNRGYIGPVLGQYIKSIKSNEILFGYDSDLFLGDITNDILLGDSCYDVQFHGDVRKLPITLFKKVDTVVSLAAVSNDPMGKAFKVATREVNELSVVEMAKSAKSNGVKRFVFASSCSVYGFGGTQAKTEIDKINPLTDYAVSKINAEQSLMELSDENFKVVCLRFATACGVSDRTRLDLVLNDFVWSLLTTGVVTVLSDGTPLRPLIDVTDMSRAIYWASNCEMLANFEIYNCGFNQANYSVAELATAVAQGDMTKVSINLNAEPDKRSYKVDFTKFEKASGFVSPLKPLELSIQELLSQFYDIKKRYGNADDVAKNFKRHETLNKLINNKVLNDKLEWSR